MKTIACIQRLVSLTRGYRLRIALCSVVGIVYVCVSLVFIAVCKQLVDIATGHSDKDITLFIALMLGSMLLQITLSSLENRLNSLNTVSLRNMLRHKLFVRLMNSIHDGNETFHTGDILNRTEGDTTTVTQTLCTALPNTVITLFQLAAAFTFLLILESRLAWILLFIMPVAILSSKLYMKRMREQTKRIRGLDSEVQTHMQEHLQHSMLLRSMEYVSHSVDTLASLQTNLKKETMRRTDFSLFSRTVVQLGFAAGYATAFLWGIFGLQSGAVTFGMMTAFLQLVAQVQRPIVELSRQIPSFVQTLTSVERLEELNAVPQEEQGVPILLTGGIGLMMKDVTFAYPTSSKNVINHFTHNFKPGTTTAIIGETGVGKSTLIRLILSLLSPQSGEITLYNSTKEVKVSPLTRCNLVYVPQGNTLISGTIRDNLLLGDPEATDAEMEDALRTAAAEFVLSLPNGIDTKCSELGSGLSEGQAQRIAIARAILKNAPILILDEATSALDNESERLVSEALERLMTNRTTIMIAHRLSTLERADVVVEI